MYEFTGPDLMVAGIILLLAFGVVWVWLFEVEVEVDPIIPFVIYEIGKDCLIHSVSDGKTVIQMNKLLMAVMARPGQVIEVRSESGDLVLIGSVMEVNGHFVTIGD